MRLHEPIPTIVAAHQFRCASADAAKRARVGKSIGGALVKPGKIESYDSVLEDLRLAVYAAFLAAFIQGLTLNAKAGNEFQWDINFVDVINIWRAGCIIRSGYIADVLEKVYKESDKTVRDYPLMSSLVTDEFKKSYAALRRIVSLGTATDATIPSLSATLEYLKYTTTDDDLPTAFMEAELDYFGYHMFDLKSEGTYRPPETGTLSPGFFLV